MPAPGSTEEGEPLLLPQAFNFVFVREGEPVGTYRRVMGKLRDRYVMELGPGLEGVDRRLVLAFAIGLDALQDR
jgi:hypothetical protein